MKYLGMIRKIDELGRIVIPKEIRKNINIHDGEELEFIIDNDAIILKKNKGIFNNIMFLKKLCLSFSKKYQVDMVFTDLDKSIISNNDNLINKNLDNKLKELISNRESLNEYGSFLEMDKYYFINPIIIDGNCYGLLMLLSDKTIEDEIVKAFDLLENIIVSMYEIS